MSEHFQLQHLDIKPENLLVVGGHVKVADFGLVKDVQDVTVSLMGGMTPVYAAPEVFDGRPSLQSDQYSLAIVYQEMLTGVLPFPGKTPAQLTSQHLHGHPRLTPLSAADRPVIARALDKVPQRRFHNCCELIEALRGAERVPPVSTAPALPKTPAREVFRTITISNLEASCDTEAKARAKIAPPIPIASASNIATQSSEAAARQEPCAPADQASPVREAARAQAAEPVEEPSASEANYEEFDTHTRNTLNSIASLGSVLAASRPAEPPSAEFENLPAFDSSFATAEFRPVLVIGVGGIAARVLQHLQRRWQQRFDELVEMPIFETLLLDTDAQTLARMSSSADLVSRLMATEHLPLRKPEDYRDKGDQITRWLAHRWIYNIPRSLHTDGLRPLGRLALMDNAAAVTDRLRKTLKRLTSPESLEAAGKKLGTPISNSSPLVYLVAAISGGTGSGAILDLGYAVRQAATIEGLAAARVCGVLLHAASRHPAEQKLAVANAHACLSELYAYERKFPGEPAWGVPAAQDGRAPFDDTYFLHLGDDLGENQLSTEAEKVADYLDVDTGTTCRAFFEQCRTAAVAADPERNLRSMGLSRLGFTADDIPADDVESFCRQLADYWHQSPLDVAPRVLSPPSAGCARPSLALATILDFETLAEKVAELVREQVGASDENALQQTLDRSCGLSDASSTDQPTVTRAQETLDALFSTVRTLADGGCMPTAGGDEPVFPPLGNLAAAEGAAVRARILDQLDRTDGTLAGLQKTLDDLRKELNRREREVCERQERVREIIAQAEVLLAPQPAPGKKTWIRRLFLQEKRSASSPCWNDYAHSRLELVVLSGQRYLWHTLYGSMTVLNEQFREMRQEMQAVSQELHSASPEAEAGQANGNWAFEAFAKNAWHELLAKNRRSLAGRLERRLRHTIVADFVGLETNVLAKVRLPKARADSLRQAVRVELGNLLREVDLAGLVLASPGNADAPSPLQLLIDRAKPPQYAKYGGTQRLLVASPKNAATEKLKADVETTAQVGPSSAQVSGGEFVFCYEVEGVPIRRIAAHLLENHEDCREIAAKLRARIDVSWPRDF
jgi:serine/threonine protein kinase